MSSAAKFWTQPHAGTEPRCTMIQEGEMRGAIDEARSCDPERVNASADTQSATIDDATDENEPYCRECGCEILAYIAQYANGRAYKCSDCGTEFMW